MSYPIMIIIIIIAILVILLAYHYIYKSNKEFFNDPGRIPKKIYFTYHNKNKIPDKVYKNLDKYAKGYKYKVFDDEECRTFIKNYYKNDKDFDHNEIIKTFNSLRLGAHKSDLFRYCLLYKLGGIYLDIKTELIKPIDEIFNRNNCCYIILNNEGKRVYNGIIATPPGNKIFIDQIKFIINNVNVNYFKYIEYFYECLKNKIKDMRLGYNKCGDLDYYFYEEYITKNKNECNGLLDRYGLCVYVHSEDKRIIKIRFHDYPW